MKSVKKYRKSISKNNSQNKNRFTNNQKRKIMFTIEESKKSKGFKSVKENISVIENARKDGKFMSIDDLKIRSKVGVSVTDLLKKFGCLDGMSQSNQISLFG